LRLVLESSYKLVGQGEAMNNRSAAIMLFFVACLILWTFNVDGFCAGLLLLLWLCLVVVPLVMGSAVADAEES